MAPDSIPVISTLDKCINDQKEEKNQVKPDVTTTDNISVIHLNEESNNEDDREIVVTETVKSAYMIFGKLLGFTIAIVALTVLFVVPLTTIPRTNSIIHQSHWLEMLLPFLSIWILEAGADQLNLAVCTATIDFVLHSHITYKLVKENNKVSEQASTNGNVPKTTHATNLILAELVEGFTPMMYAICMTMAFYGSNARLLAGIQSTLWGKPMNDIFSLYYTMLFLFTIDTISAALNSIILWKMLNINMLREFHHVIRNYWLFMVVKLGADLTSYFASIDVNLGMDSGGLFEWITATGRLDLILHAPDLSQEEKAMLIDNTTMI